MSTTIDNRVVSMEFDNKKFESNVEESLNTLKKLNSSLDNLGKGSAKGIDTLTNSLGNVRFDSMASSIDSISNRFTLLGQIGTKIIGEIADSVVGLITTAKRGIDSLTIDQVSAGWQKYADKTQSVATIMNATGDSIDYINQKLDQLMWFTDETSYDFVDMTNSIGKFTSAGVELDTAVTAMQGISNWAAISGQNASKASIAMYNLSQAIGSGSLKLADWKSIELANMATSEFKETLLDTAVELGTLNGAIDENNVKWYYLGDNIDDAFTKESMRDYLKKEFVTNEVLTATLEKYGRFSQILADATNQTGITATEFLKYIDEYMAGSMTLEDIFQRSDVYFQNMPESMAILSEYMEILASKEEDLGRRAFKAAQEAKTFTDAVNATKDAVSSSWMRLFENIFGNYEEQKSLWTQLANDMADIFSGIPERLNNILESANSNYETDLVGVLSNSGIAIDEFEKKVEESMKRHGLNVETLKDEYGSLTEAIANAFNGSDTDLDVRDTILAEVAAAFRTRDEINSDNAIIQSFREQGIAIDALIEKYGSLQRVLELYFDDSSEQKSSSLLNSIISRANEILNENNAVLENEQKKNEALITVCKNHGLAVDDLIKTYGSLENAIDYCFGDSSEVGQKLTEQIISESEKLYNETMVTLEAASSRSEEIAIRRENAIIQACKDHGIAINDLIDQYGSLDKAMNHIADNYEGSDYPAYLANLKKSIIDDANKVLSESEKEITLKREKAIIQVCKDHGIAIDDLIKKYGSLERAMDHLADGYEGSDYPTYLANLKKSIIDEAEKTIKETEKVTKKVEKKTKEITEKSAIQIHNDVVRFYYAMANPSAYGFKSQDEVKKYYEELGYNIEGITKLANEWENSNKSDPHGRKVFNYAELREEIDAGNLFAETIEDTIEATESYKTTAAGLEYEIRHLGDTSYRAKDMIVETIKNISQTIDILVNKFRNIKEAVFPTDVAAEKLKEITLRMAIISRLVLDFVGSSDTIYDKTKEEWTVVDHLINLFVILFKVVSDVTSGLLAFTTPLLKIAGVLVLPFGTLFRILTSIFDVLGEGLSGINPIKDTLFAIADIITALSTLLKADVAKKLDDFYDKHIGKIIKWTSIFADSIRLFIERIQRLSDAIKEAKTFSEAMDLIGVAFQNVGKRLYGKIKKTLDKIILNVNAEITRLKYGLQSLFKGDFGLAKIWLGSTWTGKLITKITSQFKDIKDKVLGYLNNNSWYQEIKKWFKNQIDNIVFSVTTEFYRLKWAFQNLFNGNFDMAKIWFNSTWTGKLLSKVKSQIKGIKDKVLGYLDTTGWYKEIKKKLNNQSGEILSVITAEVTRLKYGIQSLVRGDFGLAKIWLGSTWTGQLFGTLKDQFKEIKDKVLGYLDNIELYQEVKNWIKEQTNKIKINVTAEFTRLKYGFQSLFKGDFGLAKIWLGSTWTGNLIKNVKEQFKDLKNKLLGYLGTVDWYQDIKKWFKTQIDKIQYSITTEFYRLKWAFQNLFSGNFDLAKYWFSSTWTGKLISTAENKIKDIKDNIIGYLNEQEWYTNVTGWISEQREKILGSINSEIDLIFNGLDKLLDGDVEGSKEYFKQTFLGKIYIRIREAVKQFIKNLFSVRKEADEETDKVTFKGLLKKLVNKVVDLGKKVYELLFGKNGKISEIFKGIKDGTISLSDAFKYLKKVFFTAGLAVFLINILDGFRQLNGLLKAFKFMVWSKVFVNLGFGLLELAGSLWIFAKSTEIFGNMGDDEYSKGIRRLWGIMASILAAFLAISLIAKKILKIDFKENEKESVLSKIIEGIFGDGGLKSLRQVTKMISAFAILIGVIAFITNSFAKAAKDPNKDFDKAIDAVMGIIISLGVLIGVLHIVSSITGNAGRIDKIGNTFLGIAAAIAILSIVISKISKYIEAIITTWNTTENKWTKVLSTIISIGVVVALIAGVIVAINKLDNKGHTIKGGLGLIAIVASVGLLAFVVTKVAQYIAPFQNMEAKSGIWAATGVIAAIGAIVAGIVWLIGTSHRKDGGATLADIGILLLVPIAIGVVAIIAAFLAVLQRDNNLDILTINGILFVIAVSISMIVGIAGRAKSIKGGINALLSMLGIVFVVNTIGEALATLKDVKLDSSVISIIFGIVVILGAIEIAIATIAESGIGIGAAIIGIVSVIALAGAIWLIAESISEAAEGLAELSVSMKKLNDISDDIDFSEDSGFNKLMEALASMAGPMLTMGLGSLLGGKKLASNIEALIELFSAIPELEKSVSDTNSTNFTVEKVTPVFDTLTYVMEQIDGFTKGIIGSLFTDYNSSVRMIENLETIVGKIPDLITKFDIIVDSTKNIKTIDSKGNETTVTNIEQGMNTIMSIAEAMDNVSDELKRDNFDNSLSMVQTISDMSVYFNSISKFIDSMANLNNLDQAMDNFYSLITGVVDIYSATDISGYDYSGLKQLGDGLSSFTTISDSLNSISGIYGNSNFDNAKEVLLSLFGENGLFKELGGTNLDYSDIQVSVDILSSIIGSLDQLQQKTTDFLTEAAGKETEFKKAGEKLIKAFTEGLKGYSVEGEDKKVYSTNTVADTILDKLNSDATTAQWISAGEKCAEGFVLGVGNKKNAIIGSINSIMQTANSEGLLAGEVNTDNLGFGGIDLSKVFGFDTSKISGIFDKFTSMFGEDGSFSTITDSLKDGGALSNISNILKKADGPLSKIESILSGDGSISTLATDFQSQLDTVLSQYTGENGSLMTQILGGESGDPLGIGTLSTEFQSQLNDLLGQYSGENSNLMTQILGGTGEDPYGISGMSENIQNELNDVVNSYGISGTSSFMGSIFGEKTDGTYDFSELQTGLETALSSVVSEYSGENSLYEKLFGDIDDTKKGLSATIRSEVNLAISGTKESKGLLDSIKSQFTDPTNGLGAAIRKDIIDNLSKEDNTGLLDSIKSKFVDAETGLGASIKNNIISNLGNTEELSTAISNLSASMTSKESSTLITDVYISSINQLKIDFTDLTSIVNTFAESLNDKKRELIDIIKEIMESVDDIVGSDIHYIRWYTAGQYDMLGYIFGVRYKVPECITEAHNMMLKVYNVLVSSYSWKLWKESGMYVSEGFAKGISEGSSSVITAASSLVDYAKNSIEKRAVIKSPSKLFAEVGKYIPLGLAKGILNESDRVTEASGKVINDAISFAEYSMNLISTALQSDFTPTITPVLDMSNVQGLYDLDRTYGVMRTTQTLASDANIIMSKNQNEKEKPMEVKASLDSESMAALLRTTNAPINVQVGVDFEGSLSQLATLLYPHIKAEGERVGPSLINT